MDDALVIKALIVVLTMPWWLRVARIVARATWAVSGSDDVRRRENADLFEYDELGWSPDRRHDLKLMNSPWTIGRPKVRRRPTGFRRTSR